LNQGKNQWLNVVNVLRGAAAAAGTTFNVENTIQYSPRDYQVVQVAQLYEQWIGSQKVESGSKTATRRDPQTTFE